MKKIALIFLGVLLLGLIVVGSFVGIYNDLQLKDEQINNQLAQIENQLKRRNDLIPNYVNTVKGYAKHEKDVFENVAKARAGLMNAKGMGEISKANSQLEGALSRLIAVAERYPELKASENFKMLQDELAGTENRIAVARKDYNEAVKNLNGQIRVFPSNIIANMLGIEKRQYFEVLEQEKQNVNVQFTE